MRLAFGFVLPLAAAAPVSAIEWIEPARLSMRLGAIGSAAAEEQRLREQRDAQTRARELDTPDVRGKVAELHDPDLAGVMGVMGETERFPALPAQTPCFAIDRFELSVPASMPAAAQIAGASALPQDPFAFAAAWLNHYAGQCIGQQAINRLTQGLTREIFRHGYVTTRVNVPEQNLSERRLKIHLMPGLIHAIRFSDPALRASWRMAWPTRPGELLKLADIEQALVQFEQVPGQSADLQIVPTGEAGQDDVVITLARERPWRLSAVLDNSGSHATGKVIGTLGLSLDNPLGLNDRLALGFSHDLMVADRAQGWHGWNAFYAVPMGYWTASLSGWGNHYYQRVQGRRISFVSTGESQIGEVQLARTLLRTRASTIGIQFKLGKRIGRSLIEDYAIQNQRRNNTYVQFGVSERLYFGAARFDAMLSYRQGVPWLGALGDPNGQGTYLYRMALLDANLSVPFGVGRRPFVYTSAFHGQTTADRLFRIDDIALGARWSVRGFDGERTLSAERGFYWRNDLAMPLGRGRQAVYVGVDYGQVYGPNSARLAGTRLAGAVLGIRGVAGSPGGTSRAAAAIPEPVSQGGGAGRDGPSPGVPSAGVADASSLPADLAATSSTSGALGASSSPAPSPQWANDLASLSLPGVLTYDLYAGTPLWKPEGFQSASLTVGFQLAYLY